MPLHLLNSIGYIGGWDQVVGLIRTRDFQMKLAARLENVAPDNNACLFRRKPVLPNCLPEFLYSKSITGLQLYGRQTLVQTHIHALYPRELSKCSAHGEGTRHSIHAEDRKIELKQLCTRGLECQNDGE